MNTISSQKNTIASILKASNSSGMLGSNRNGFTATVAGGNNSERMTDNSSLNRQNSFEPSAQQGKLFSSRTTQSSNNSLFPESSSLVGSSIFNENSNSTQSNYMPQQYITSNSLYTQDQFIKTPERLSSPDNNSFQVNSMNVESRLKELQKSTSALKVSESAREKLSNFKSGFSNSELNSNNNFLPYTNETPHLSTYERLKEASKVSSQRDGQEKILSPESLANQRLGVLSESSKKINSARVGSFQNSETNKQSNLIAESKFVMDTLKEDDLETEGSFKSSKRSVSPQFSSRNNRLNSRSSNLTGEGSSFMSNIKPVLFNNLEPLETDSSQDKNQKESYKSQSIVEKINSLRNLSKSENVESMSPKSNSGISTTSLSQKVAQLRESNSRLRTSGSRSTSSNVSNVSVNDILSLETGAEKVKVIKVENPVELEKEAMMKYGITFQKFFNDKDANTIFIHGIQKNGSHVIVEKKNKSGIALYLNDGHVIEQHTGSELNLSKKIIESECKSLGTCGLFSQDSDELVVSKEQDGVIKKTQYLISSLESERSILETNGVISIPVIQFEDLENTNEVYVKDLLKKADDNFTKYNIASLDDSVKRINSCGPKLVELYTQEQNFQNAASLARSNFIQSMITLNENILTFKQRRDIVSLENCEKTRKELFDDIRSFVMFCHRIEKKIEHSTKITDSIKTDTNLFIEKFKIWVPKV
uniref:Uncharacterized protein n=1 Tax=viral metagenome TaxID=1070528 RepID=A0A6C0BFB0_9ZZZZ